MDQKLHLALVVGVGMGGGGGGGGAHDAPNMLFIKGVCLFFLFFFLDSSCLRSSGPICNSSIIS